MSDIFISYSRDDKAFVQQLHEAFSQEKQDIWIDWESIAPSKAWWDEIKRGIAIANNFVMVMSPNSMSSPICHMEIEHARILGKRIIPVLYKPFDEMCINRISERLNKPDQVFTRELWGTRQEFTLFHENQKALAPINYFFFAPEDDFNNKFQKLLEIIQTDFDHKESHTRLGLRAEQWANRNHDVSFLLDGEELKGAERWMEEALKQGKMPPPTTLQTEYIRASRADED
ncbi:MAG TPA: toll/interleukin-1 receptor domain-containing protein, partial [Aggregatilineales bacterium]|nr:toll/interleukin-1 receptor domain-containing protein [Aggregatilineales bacterium]